MNPPPDELRQEVATESERLREEADDDAEQGLVDLLQYIRDAMNTELESDDLNGEDQAEDLLAAVDAWCSLASHAAINVYAPGSPFPRRLAGWKKKAAAELRKFGRDLSGKLEDARDALGASGYSIAVNFPWGISVGISW